MKKEPLNKIIQGDALKVLKKMPDESVDCVITSPPYYGLRDYGASGQLGLEENLADYLNRLLLITAEIKRVLKSTGTLWWNHGDSYAHAPSGKSGAGSTLNGGRKTQNNIAKAATTKKWGFEMPYKSLTLQAHRLVMRMVDEQGWILRNEIVWHKPNVMPASAKDRFTVDFEKVFFFVKKQDYYFEQQKEPLSPVSIERVKYGWKSKKANITGIEVEKMGERFGNPAGRNKRTVWRVPTSSSKISHIAMFPEKLIEPMIRAGCPRGGVVLDPFMGSGTTALVALKLDRKFLGIEINPSYIKDAEDRLKPYKNKLL